MSAHRRMPVFPERVCPRFAREGEAGECGFVKAGSAWECKEHQACRHRVHPGQDGYDALTKYDAEMTALSMTHAEQLDDLFDDDGPACRVCGCTERHACAGGCGWVREPKKQAEERSAPICTYCERLVDKAYERIRNAPHDQGLPWKTLLAEMAEQDEGNKERAAKVILELLFRERVDAQLEAIKPRRGRRA